MRKLIKIIAVIAFSAACTRSVYIYATCAQVNVPCACSATLHGVQGCDHGQTTGQCICVAAVAPSITINGSPAALSSGGSYTATVNAVPGLSYSWSVSGGAITSGVTGTSVTFTAGSPGVALITADTTNSGGDSAPPAVLGINVVASPTKLEATEVTIPPTVTQNRQGVVLRVKNPIGGFTYVWSVDAGNGTIDATVDPTGAVVHWSTNAAGQATVSVAVQNSVGAQSDTLDTPVTVVPKGVELLAGVLKNSPDGVGASARFGFRFNLATDGAGNIYVGDANNGLVRRIDPSTQEVTTIAGVSSVLSDPVVATLTDTSLIVGEDPDSGCPLAVLSDLTNANGATQTAPGACTGLPFAQVTSIVAASHSLPTTIYVSDDTSVYSFTLDTNSNMSVPLTLSAAGPTQVAFSSGTITTLVLSQDNSKIYIADGQGLWEANSDFSKNDFADPTPEDDDLTPTFVPMVDTVVQTIEGMALSGTTLYLSLGCGVFTTTAGTWGAPVLVAGSAAGATATPVEGVGGSAVFSDSGAVALFDTTLYVADGERVRSVDTGSTQTAFVAGSDTVDQDGQAGGPPARFGLLAAIAVAPDETTYLLDSPLGADPTEDLEGATCKLKTLSPSLTVTDALGKGCGKAQNGPVEIGLFDFPQAITFGNDGSVYVADSDSATFVEQIRKTTPAGLLLTAAGATQTGAPSEQDGFTASALFSSPTALASAADGTIIVADSIFASGESGTLRVILGDQVVTLAGDPNCTPDSDPLVDGFGDECFAPLTSLAIDAAGTIYATGSINDGSDDFILTFTPPLYVPTVLVQGNSANCANTLRMQPQSCSSACLTNPQLAINPGDGSLYFGDGELIRKVVFDSSGACSVDHVAGVAGTAAVSVTDDLTTSTFNSIQGIAFSPSTLDLYVIDRAENVVVRIRY